MILLAAGKTEIQIEHIGSTSVPGLIAKPIIDIGVLLSDPSEFPELTRALASIGWIYRGNKGTGRGGRLFVFESEPFVRTHHLHAYWSATPDWERYLRFNNALRKHAELRMQYGLLKSDLAKRFPDDQNAYMDAKSEFVEQVLSLAESDQQRDDRE